ncbi:MAG: hypothetical protein DRH49_05910 [Candidatus Coatesbacteria bacterium]|nr:MAG: hypothetical protein DRH49_05910 [Candidatus Coatesbacteria bacterium]
MLVTECTTGEEEFIQRIVTRYLYLKQRGLVISPRDWQYICRWLAQNIPLITVLKALEIGFAEMTEHTARVRSLAYIDRIVTRLERERRLMQIGRPKENETKSTSEVMRDGLTRIIAELEEIAKKEGDLAHPISNTILNIRRLIDEIDTRSLDFDHILKRVTQIEDGLFRSVFNRLEEEKKRYYEKKADKTLTRFKANMPEKAIQSTKRKLIKSIVLRDFDLPPFNPLI